MVVPSHQQLPLLATRFWNTYNIVVGLCVLLHTCSCLDIPCSVFMWFAVNFFFCSGRNEDQGLHLEKERYPFTGSLGNFCAFYCASQFIALAYWPESRDIVMHCGSCASWLSCPWTIGPPRQVQTIVPHLTLCAGTVFKQLNSLVLYWGPWRQSAWILWQSWKEYPRGSSD
jgi:hypothetical protein